MATKQQVPVIAARLVEFQEEFFKLSVKDSQWMIQNGREAAKLVVDAVANRVKAIIQVKDVSTVVTPVLSNAISSCIIWTTIGKFIAKDKFVVNTKKNAEVKISCVGNKFINWFLEKTEEPFSGSTVWGRKLKKDSVDGPILAELGGQEKAETTLFELFATMKRHGQLFNDGRGNIFYIRDITGILRAVVLNWNGGGWRVGACSVDDLDGWFTDDCVFSNVEQIQIRAYSVEKLMADWVASE